MTCTRAQEFLAQAKATIGEHVNARQVKLGPKEALRIAHAARHVYVAKGKKLVHFDLRKDVPTDEELLKHLLGPSGNLRAPAIRRGDRLFVGFNAEEFATALLK